MIALVLTVTEEGVPGSEQYAFIKSPVRIGRGDINDLPLRHGFVSTFHASVDFDDQAIHYVDLKSLNGSELDGERLAPNTPVPVGPGAEVRIPAGEPVPGTLRLTFERKPVPEQAPPRAPLTSFGKSLINARVADLASRPRPAAPEEPGETERAQPVSTPPPDPAAEAAAARALDAASPDLDRAFISYRGTWQHFSAKIEGSIQQLQGPARRLALERIASRYPEVVSEPQFAALLSETGAGTSAGTGSTAGAAAGAARAAGAGAPGQASKLPPEAPGGDVLRLLRKFFEAYLPAIPERLSASEVEAILTRLASALEAFARAFIELRTGYEEFGKDVGVGMAHGDGPLQRAADARQLLAYVLDPRATGRERELHRGFADFMIHQVAVQRGVVEGAQSLLEHLSPHAVERKVSQSLWVLRAQALWKAYEERYHEIADDSDAVFDLLFGKEFARAYFAMAGQRGSEEPRRERGPAGRAPGPGGEGEP